MDSKRRKCFARPSGALLACCRFDHMARRSIEGPAPRLRPIDRDFASTLDGLDGTLRDVAADPAA
jgi:hypothetical protein